MTMRERIDNGQLFTDYCEGLPQDRVDGKLKMWALNNSAPDRPDNREKLIEETFSVEGNVTIEPPIYFCYGYNISIGSNSYINVNCNFINDGKINIGQNVMFGPAVTIATVGHPVHPDYRRYMYTDAVTIGDGCWIGAGVTICPGVTIGENSVIGAGSVVVKDIPSNTVAVGNPCKPLREINDNDLKHYYKDREITTKDLEEESKLSGR